jgi:hypothetical protein
VAYALMLISYDDASSIFESCISKVCNIHKEEVRFIYDVKFEQ